MKDFTKVNEGLVMSWLENDNSIPKHKFLTINMMFEYFQIDEGRNDSMTLKSFKHHVNTCSQPLKYLLKIENPSERYNEKYVIFK